MSKKTKQPEKKTEEREIRENFRCLLVRTNEPETGSKNDVVENRSPQFFTKRKNWAYLVEFAKTFGAELVPVRVKKAEILPLKDLPELFCDSKYTCEAEYEIESPISKEGEVTEAEADGGDETVPQGKVPKAILKSLIWGRTVTMKGLAEELDVSESTVRRHFASVRSWLERHGYRLSSNTKRGEYIARKISRVRVGSSAISGSQRSGGLLG